MNVRVSCVVIASIFAWGGVARSQPESQTAAEPTQATEEVVVRGRSLPLLRAQIEVAEEAVYARFNEINSRDEFDIHCRDEVFIGSRIPRRICEPNFSRAAKRNIGVETVRAMQGSASLNPSLFQAEALYKERLLEEELRELIRQDEALLAAVTRLATLKEAVSGREPPAVLAASRVVTAEDEALPYGAALQADVRAGSEPWRHELTARTFTIANVFGTVHGIELDCGAQSNRLDFERGSEWTLPEGWTDCAVYVEATPGSTFSLYEFE